MTNRDDFKAMWKQRYGEENVYYSEAYMFRGQYLNETTDAEANELVNRVEIGGVYFKVEE
jgi:hypothetical protein